MSSGTPSAAFERMFIVRQTKTPSVFPRTGAFIQPVAWIVLSALLTATLVLVSTQNPIPHLSIVITGLTLLVGTSIAIYCMRYMRSDERRTLFFATLIALVLSVLLFVLADNVIIFSIGWLSSGLLLASLIGHAKEWKEADMAARRSRKAFLIGDAAVLGALAMLCWNAGTWQLSAAVSALSGITTPFLNIIALLLLIGAAARCALPPFSGWLLSSMTAPTPVSALMHAGLVNAGGFLLLRFAPVLEAAPSVRYIVVATGFFAALWGIGVMMVKPDIKRSLAGSTVSQMGFMIMSCGLGAYAVALWHIVAHGLFKAWLFLDAGSSIGMKVDRRPSLEPRLVAFVAVAAVVIGSLLASTRTITAELVPLLLAVSTAFATLGGIVASDLRIKSRIALVGGLMAVMMLHVVGFETASALLPVAIGPSLSPILTVLLLSAFLGSWVWQSRRITSRKPLPAPLYVRLLNAGMIHPARTGDRP